MLTPWCCNFMVVQKFFYTIFEVYFTLEFIEYFLVPFSVGSKKSNSPLSTSYQWIISSYAYEH